MEIIAIDGVSTKSSEEKARQLRTVTETSSGIAVAGGNFAMHGTDDTAATGRNTEMLLGIQERLLDAVHGAKWHDAIVLHEQALAVVRSMRGVRLPPSVRSMSEDQLEAGLLACLGAAGHQETALQRA